MTEISLIYYSDDSHGWIRVSKKLINDLGLESSISEYSYKSKTGQTWYLEEDSDASKLVTRLRDLGVKVNFKDVNHNGRSFIRSLKGVKSHD